MHFTANQGIEGNTFAVTGALGFVGSALCLDLVRRGALQVRAFDLRPASPWSDDLKIHGVNIIQGSSLSAIQTPFYCLFCDSPRRCYYNLSALRIHFDRPLAICLYFTLFWL